MLDAPAGYVRVHGFEPLQQEQMVLQYVDAHGHITRTEAAELCSLTPDQASRLLRRLASAGKLTRRGERRGAVVCQAWNMKRTLTYSAMTPTAT